MTSLNAFPTVSIVINNYNYASFIRQAIDSSLTQTDPQHEFVVMKDGLANCNSLKFVLADDLALI